MYEWVAFWWHRSLTYYHVDPVIFLALYIPKTVIYYWTIFRIVASVRRKEFSRVPPLVVLNVTTNLSPWIYVYLWGQNLPAWFPLVLLVVLFGTLYYLGRSVRKRLTQAQLAEVEQEDVVGGLPLGRLEAAEP